VAQASEYGRHIGQFARLAAGIVDEFGKRRRRYASVDDQNIRIGPNDADGSKILDRIVGRLRRQRNDYDLRRASHQQHVSVGRRAGDRFGRDRAACRWAVLDHELLPKRVAEGLRDQTRNAVAIAARCKGNDDLDRLLRPDL
jgi:hypothetical protein